MAEKIKQLSQSELISVYKGGSYNSMTHRKVYVSVNLDVSADGKIRPRSIRWEDGHVYEIDRLKQCIPAASTKVGGCGMRYTVMICGKETYLFNEDTRWFVEAKEVN